MSFSRLIPSDDLEQLQQLAKQLQQEEQIELEKALDLIAEKAGFPNWAQVIQSNAVIKPTEDAFNSGYVLVFDCKEGMDLLERLRLEDDKDPDLIYDQLLNYTLESPMFELYGELEDEEANGKKQKDVYSRSQLIQYFSDWFGGFEFFRVNDKHSDKTLKELLSLIREYSFWPPIYVWSKGKCINTYDLPATDEEGNVVGVRL